MEFCLSQITVRELLDSIHEGILVVDRECVVRYVNPAYSRITGVSWESIVGRPLKEVRPRARLPEVVKSGKPLLGVLREEKGVHYVVDMFPIMRDGETVGGVSIVFDITQVRRLTEQLARSEMMVEGFRNRLREMHRAKRTFDDVVGKDSGLSTVVAYARKAAQSDAPVLICGPTGTGKELIAEAIHNASSRSGGPFVVVNCAAIPAQLMESELFGYVEGSFTGARRGGKAGLFQTAHLGTIFLDEIGELPLDLQAKLLRVIQTRRVRPVGANEETDVDVRIISATNRRLERAVKEGTFREDLYYRLNVLRIDIPSLAERKEDIPQLVDYVLQRFSKKWGRSFLVTREAMQILESYHWPGNVRELENVLEHAVHFAGTQPIGPEHLPEVIRTCTITLERSPTVSLLAQEVAEGERRAILEALQRHGRSVRGKRAAAQELGISLATLYNRLREYGIR